MSHHGVYVEFRFMNEADERVVHDRYLSSEDLVYNTPPWNIIDKKYGDVTGTEQPRFTSVQHNYQVTRV